MALLDVSLVTKALVALVRAHIGASPLWPLGTDPTVTADPPDKLGAGSLGIYLYHITEDGYLKNAPPPGTGPVPVAQIPMALSLHYQVSAAGAGEGDLATLQEQLLMTGAMKALHDHPVVDDSTVLPRKSGQAALEVLKAVGLDDAGNVLRIGLEPVTAHEATSYWSSGTHATRLSAYYEVSAVLLEPDRPRALSGRVYRYGVPTLVGTAPRVDGAENTVRVAVPGLPPQDLVARPAEVPVGGQFTVTGYNLTGDDTTLQLQPAGGAPVEAESSWAVAATPDAVTATVQETLGGLPLVPGAYIARVVVAHRLPLPGGGFRNLPVSSNGTPFSIAARIDSAVVAADAVAVSGYAFASPDPRLPAFGPEAVQVCLADTMLTERTSTGTLDPGEFRVASATRLDLRLPAAVASGPPGTSVSLRVFVRGAESPPEWLTL